MNYRTAAHEAIAKAVNPARSLGYIPDVDHKRRQKDAALLVGATPAVPPRASLTHLEAPIGDQGYAGACGGFGLCQEVYTSMAAAGTPLPWVPSMKTFYDLARILQRVDASQKLTDSGVMPTDLLTVLPQYGA